MTLTPEIFAFVSMLIVIVGGYIKLERRLIIQEVQQNLILNHLGIKTVKETNNQ